MLYNEENLKKLSKEKGFVLKTKTGRIARIFDKEKRRSEHLKWVMDDLYTNRNHSWYEEIYNKNKGNLDDVALFYRGSHITYGQMFDYMKEYAKSLKTQGVQKGMEIPISMSNTPELVYLLGAASMIGAKVNIFGTDFDRDYLTEIINNCDSPVMFIEDIRYADLVESIRNANKKKIVMTSLTDSLPSGVNPYEELDRMHGMFQRKVEEYQQQDDNILNIDEFISTGSNYQGKLLEKSSLEDIFSITYSSGSTNSTRPKAIVHSNRSFNVMGRYHDKEVSGVPSMKDLVIQIHIPTHSNTDIIAGISDGLMQGSVLALEPTYLTDFFPYTLEINKPNFIVASRGFWINYAKQVLYNPSFKNVKAPYLLFPFSVGEPLSVGEEKFCNRALKKLKAGTRIKLKDKEIKLPITPARMSVAGGDCEHGGVFYTLFRSLQSKLPYCSKRNMEAGLGTYDMVDYAVLDKDGKYCDAYQMGRLVVNSPCNMVEYKNNPEATEDFWIEDAYGKIWGDCNVYSFYDEKGKVHMKGRIPKYDEELPLFMIADQFLEDSDNIMSCEVVKPNDNPNLYVAHVEFMPKKDALIPVEEVQARLLLEAEERCREKFGEDVANNLVYHIRPFDHSYPLGGCAKRSVIELEKENTAHYCVKPIYDNNSAILVPVEIENNKVKVR